MDQLGTREERNRANRCLFKPCGSIGGAGFLGMGLGCSPEPWCKALIHLGALAQTLREQMLAWRLAVGWFSLKMSLHCLIEV